MNRFAYGLAAFGLCVGMCSCSSRPKPQPVPAAPVPSSAVGPVAPTAHKATPPPAPASPCRPLQPNEVSDDETPSVAGTSGWAAVGPWLAARGVSKTAFRAWVRARDPRNTDDFDADTLYDAEQGCQTLAVGDKREDALVCTIGVRTSIMRFSSVAFVVRNKRVVSVLDVGYGLFAMDWPDSRWLDLQLTFLPGGLEADLHDRAKPGAVLVSAPSACQAYFARYLACEKAHQDGSASDDVCPRTMDASGHTSIGHLTPLPPSSPLGGDRVALHGCAVALPKLDDLVKEGAGGPFAAEFRDDRAFAVKNCKARGRFVWKGDRFVRSGP